MPATTSARAGAPGRNAAPAGSPEAVVGTRQRHHHDLIAGVRRRPGPPVSSSALPKVSRVPCRTSRGTVGVSSSGSRDRSGRPGRCSGKARQTTPATRRTRSAVRQATRAPALRPPTSSGRSRVSAPVSDGAHGRAPADVEPRRRHRDLATGRSARAARSATTVIPRAGSSPGQQREIHRGHAATGAVPQHQRRRRLVGRVDVPAARALRRVDLDDRVVSTGCPAAVRRRSAVDRRRRRCRLPRRAAPAATASLLLHLVDRGRHRVRLQRRRLGHREQVAARPADRSARDRARRRRTARGITIGIRSWMCPTASVASVVITEQVRSQAESSSRSLAGIAPDLVDAGHHQQAAVGRGG